MSLSLSKPEVSICIPTYNYAEFIGEALDSILMQDFQDYEVIIVDDCSTDDTLSILADHAAMSDSRFRLVTNTTNMGMVENWNHCMRLAQGEFIKFLFADDFFVEPDALTLLVSLFKNNRSVTLASSPRKVVSSASETRKVLTHFSSDVIMSGTAVIQQCLANMLNMIGEPTAVMFRKSDAARGFDADYRQLVDLEMWFHLLEKGDFAHHSQPLCAFRVHEKQQTAVNRVNPATIHETGRLYDSYLQKPYITLNAITKQYLLMDYRYQVWKGKRKHGYHADFRFYESKLSKITFYIKLLTYKTVKPFVKLFWKRSLMLVNK